MTGVFEKVPPHLLLYNTSTQRLTYRLAHLSLCFQVAYGNLGNKWGGG